MAYMTLKSRPDVNLISEIKKIKMALAKRVNVERECIEAE
jgi:hypothetical protein